MIQFYAVALVASDILSFSSFLIFKRNGVMNIFGVLPAMGQKHTLRHSMNLSLGNYRQMTSSKPWSAVEKIMRQRALCHCRPWAGRAHTNRPHFYRIIVHHLHRWGVER